LPSFPTRRSSDLVQVRLLVWIFMMRVVMVIASGAAYFINEARAKAAYQNAASFNYEHPITFLVWLTSILSVLLTYISSYMLIPNIAANDSQRWKLSTIIICRKPAGAI